MQYYEKQPGTTYVMVADDGSHKMWTHHVDLVTYEEKPPEWCFKSLAFLQIKKRSFFGWMNKGQISYVGMSKVISCWRRGVTDDTWRHTKGMVVHVQDMSCDCVSNKVHPRKMSRGGKSVTFNSAGSLVSMLKYFWGLVGTFVYVNVERFFTS